MNPEPLRIGLFGTGLDAYWPELEELEQPGVEILEMGNTNSRYR